MLALIKDKCYSLNDFKRNLEFFFIDDIELSDDNISQLNTSISIEILNCFLIELNKLKSFELFKLNHMIKSIQNQVKCSSKDIWPVLRISLTGQKHGPSLESIILIYGFDKTIKRINGILKP